MPARRYRESIVEWALGRLRALDGGEETKPVGKTPTQEPAKKVPAKKEPAKKVPAKSALVEAKPVVPAALSRIVDRFGLDEMERRAIELAYAVEVSLGVARAVRALSGARGLTVEIVREVLGLDGEGAERLFAPEGALRARGLLLVDAVPGSPASAQADVALAGGVAARIEGRAPGIESLAAGVTRIDSPTDKLLLSEPLAELIREDVADQKPRWVTVSGAGANEARVLSQAIARRLGRAVILVDGAAFDGLESRLRHAACAGLRREADLLEAPIVVMAAASLGGAFRALGASPAPGAGAPPCIVLLDEEGPPGGRPDAAFALRERSLSSAPKSRGPGDSAPSTNPAQPGAQPAAAAPASPVSEAIDRARRQAAMDAARAMGRPMPLPAPAVTRAGPPQSASPSTAPPAAPAPSATRSEAGARPSDAAASKPPAETPPKPRPEDVVGPMRPARERGAARKAEPSPPAEPRPASAEAAKPASPVVTQTSADASAPVAGGSPTTPSEGAAAAVGAAAAPDPAEALSFVDVPASATPSDLAQLIPRVPNPLQRASLIRRLATEPRDMQTVAVIRAHLKVENVGLRTAAEEAMATMFGPNWNKSRAIPKPVQPPHSDDGGKPPG